MSNERIRKTLRATTLALLCLSFAALPAAAGPDVWTRTGPLQGAVVTAIALDPSNTNIVYVGTRSDAAAKKIFRSVDGGLLFTPIGPDGLRAVSRLLVDPSNGARLYAVAADVDGSAFFRSRDAGVTWERILAAGARDRADLALDVTRPARLVASAADVCQPQCSFTEVFESTNGGDTWQLLRRLSVALEEIEMSPQIPASLYAISAARGTALGGVVRSPDGGRTWTGASGGKLESRTLIDIAISPANAAIVFATTLEPGGDGEVFKTVNGGGLWRSAHKNLELSVVNSLAFSPTNPASMFAGTEKGLFLSSNSGGAWRRAAQAGLSNRQIEALATDSARARVLYAGTAGEGVFKSVDLGATFQPKRRGIDLPTVASLDAGPGSPPVLYAGTGVAFAGGESSGVYKSLNGGLSWVNASRGLPRPRIAALAVSPNNPDVVYAAPGVQGVYKSVDGGVSWTAANQGLVPATGAAARSVLDFDFHPLQPTTLYAATDFGVYKSPDGAASWRRSSAGLGATPLARAVAVNPEVPATVYAAVNNRVYRSLDAAGTWAPTALAGVLEVLDLAIDPAVDTIYAGTDAGVFRSADGGQSWVPTADPGDGRILRLALGPGNPGVLYATVAGGGLFRSTDRGESWTVLETGRPAALTTALAVAADGPTKIFAAFGTVSGVYEWEE